MAQFVYCMHCDRQIERVHGIWVTVRGRISRCASSPSGRHEPH